MDVIAMLKKLLKDKNWSLVNVVLPYQYSLTYTDLKGKLISVLNKNFSPLDQKTIPIPDLLP